MSDLVKALRGELLDCNCCAYSRSECCCDTVWPEQITKQAADEIERLRTELNEQARLGAEREAALLARVAELEWAQDYFRYEARKEFSEGLKKEEELEKLQAQVAELTRERDEYCTELKGMKHWVTGYAKLEAELAALKAQVGEPCNRCKGTGSVCTGSIDGTPELFDCPDCTQSTPAAERSVPDGWRCKYCNTDMPTEHASDCLVELLGLLAAPAPKGEEK